MATIEEVSKAVSLAAKDIELTVLDALTDNAGMVVRLICEQLYSGLDGNGNYLNPTYDTDPFFEQEGQWYHRSANYKAWKAKITPPVVSPILGLSARPRAVPNLFINGKFYSEIFAAQSTDSLLINAGNGIGSDIVSKYGAQILRMGNTAIEYFNDHFTWPKIENLYKKSGLL